MTVPRAGLCGGTVLMPGAAVMPGAVTVPCAVMSCRGVTRPGTDVHLRLYAGRLGLGQRGGAVAAQPVGVGDHRQRRQRHGGGDDRESRMPKNGYSRPAAVGVPGPV